jgi:hypothetical protein
MRMLIDKFEEALLVSRRTFAFTLIILSVVMFAGLAIVFMRIIPLNQLPRLWVLPGVFIGVAGIVLLVLPFRRAKKRIERDEKEPFFVSERYAKLINIRAAPAYFILSICFFVAIILTEYVAAGIVGAVFISISGFGWLTTIRAEYGWFADNRYEVLELLHFIVSKSKSGGLPPGSRVSRHSSGMVQVRTSPTDEVVGSRA